MSFLDSVLSSIEKGKPAPIARPKPVASLSARSGGSAHVGNRDGRQTISASQNSRVGDGISAGTKRKAEEQLLRRLAPTDRDSVKPPDKPYAPKSTSVSSAPKPRPTSSSPALNRTTIKSLNESDIQKAIKSSPGIVSSKPPPKGSYADLMAKAKAVQEKAPTEVGMFKHRAVSKEKLSKVERKKREMEAQAKEKELKAGKKVAGTAGALMANKDKPRDVTLLKKREGEGAAYKGTARITPIPQEPVYRVTATARIPQDSVYRRTATGHTPQEPAYRGTAGLPARRSADVMRGKRRPSNSRRTNTRRSRLDEYLGTDEEDEGDFEHDDYYSDESSDMEAGLDEVEEEEAAALMAARREDEEEWRAELAAKKDKLDRRKKLAALASKSKR